MAILKSYAQLKHGQIHYRTRGQGPVMILLHQSPRSSLEYIELINKWSEHFTVIAPDTPGNGLSDPLPGKPTMFEYADTLIEFLDKLGHRAVLLYGFHTGASIATATAARYPHRITYAVANGLALLDEKDRRDFLENYLPKIALKKDGSHLNWLWHRIKKQAEYFPWYSTKTKDRLRIKPYSAEKTHAILLDFLLSGNNYRAPYRAAFAFEPVSAGLLPAANLCVFAVKTDPLLSCICRLPESQDRFVAPDYEASEEKALALLKEKAV